MFGKPWYKKNPCLILDIVRIVQKNFILSRKALGVRYFLFPFFAQGEIQILKSLIFGQDGRANGDWKVLGF